MTRPTRQNVLITGSGGFIGSHVARLIASQRHSVSLLLKPSTNLDRLKDLQGDTEFIWGDLAALQPSTEWQLERNRFDTCIHLAWKGWSGAVNADENMRSLSASLELLRLMPKIGCKRFVATGTCFEYEHGFNPLYGACKKSFANIAQTFGELNGVDVLIPRLFNCYGPEEPSRGLVPSVIRSLLDCKPAELTPGAQVRDYLHVSDVASAIWHVAQSDMTGVVDVCSGTGATVAEVANLIGALMEKQDLVQLGKRPYRVDDPLRIVGDPTRLKGSGWTPRYTLESGLVDTVNWWAQQRVTA